MKNTKYYYEDEKLKIPPFIMVVIGIGVMIYLTVLKIKEPNNLDLNGFLFAMGFMFLWTWIAFAFAYYTTIKPRLLFTKEKNNILKNGSIVNGEIVDSKKDVKMYTNREPSAWRYYAEVKLDDGNTFWTPALLFNPKNLTTNSVTVYSYENKFYATDFKINTNPVINNEEVEEDNGEVDIFMCIQSIIGGTVFSGFCGWIFLNAADMITRLSITPFLICGIGILLRGLLPLIFYSNRNKFKNIGTKIFLLGFILFWFGFLIIFDYVAIKQGQMSLLIFSLLFWIVGILIIGSQFKRLR